MKNRSGHEKPVVCQMSDNWRLVIFDELQWAIERYYGNQWRPRMYFHTKAGLKMYASEYGIPDSVIEALPDYFPATA